VTSNAIAAPPIPISAGVTDRIENGVGVAVTTSARMLLRIRACGADRETVRPVAGTVSPNVTVPTAVVPLPPVVAIVGPLVGLRLRCHRNRRAGGSAVGKA